MHSPQTSDPQGYGGGIDPELPDGQERSADIRDVFGGVRPHSIPLRPGAVEAVAAASPLRQGRTATQSWQLRAVPGSLP